MLKIATWNINSIRRRLPLVLDWLGRNRPDILCLQETKVQDSEFPADAIREAGYFAAYRGMKGYNGVATLSLREPERILHGFSDGGESDDARILQTVHAGIPVINSYVPQGFKVGSDKYAYKLDWFARLRRYFETYLDPAQPALWTGDLNVAPEPIDVYHPDRRANDPDFHLDARNAFRETAGWGFTDVFRKLHPGRVQYTYWDYFRNAFENNYGWRIDHILATAPLAGLALRADADLEPRRGDGASDHTVLWAEFAVEGGSPL